ncbi:MAG: SEL1-like repeat protein [Desulfovibrio sp.]|nr:SEL1-like repeat protein [Desulfovibrio sp.]
MGKREVRDACSPCNGEPCSGQKGGRCNLAAAFLRWRGFCSCVALSLLLLQSADSFFFSPYVYPSEKSSAQRVVTDPEARSLFLEGFAYAHGNGVKKNAHEAFLCYEKAHALGYAPATYNLARMYLQGNGVEKNVEKALEYFLIAAEKGLRLAQYSLASLYDEGGVKKDMERALYWYTKAAEQGDAWAEYRLACLYEEGKGVGQDLSKAVFWYKKSADQGNPPALNNLATLYETGRGGLEKDPSFAVRLYHKAAMKGHSISQFNLARCYQYGLGVQKSISKARAWEKRAMLSERKLAPEETPRRRSAERGARPRASRTSPSERFIDVTFRQHGSTEGRGGLASEPSGTKSSPPRLASEKEGLYRVALSPTKRKKAQALCRSALAFEKGSERTPKNLEQAMRLYEEAAKLHYTPAAYKLACLYAADTSKGQHAILAWKWFNEAASNGHTGAQFRLGQCYEKGLGVPRNLSMALYWYAQSKTYGNKEGEKSFERLQALTKNEKGEGWKEGEKIGELKSGKEKSENQEPEKEKSGNGKAGNGKTGNGESGTSSPEATTD